MPPPIRDGDDRGGRIDRGDDFVRPRIGRPVKGPIWAADEPQVLVPSDVSPNIAEGLEARVKDPLWFLARQWQTGEFEATNGGTPAQIEVAWSAWALTKVTASGQSAPVKPEDPLEAAIEQEAGAAPLAWDAARLEYEFTLDVGGHVLTGRQYDGNGLDWDTFDLASEGADQTPTLQANTRLLPSNLRFAGMPHPRWWRFEPGDVDLSRIGSDEPNFLQMLLAEYLLLDANNWYVVPLDLPAGHLRRIDHVRIADNFGVTNEIPPALGAWGSGDWQLFTLAAPAGTKIDGRYFLLLNSSRVLNGDLLEHIDIVRDEAANVVWAVERSYTDGTGARVERGDAEARRTGTYPGLAGAGQLPAELAGLAVYRLMTPVPPHWIPYLPERLEAGGSAQIYLRRGRTDESASRAAPQYRTRIVAESWRMNEEEIPRTGIRVQRLYRFARGSDGATHIWIGRRKDTTTIEDSAGIDFDYLLTP